MTSEMWGYFVFAAICFLLFAWDLWHGHAGGSALRGVGGSSRVGQPREFWALMSLQFLFGVGFLGVGIWRYLRLVGAHRNG
jgi:hypothetical protein